MNVLEIIVPLGNGGVEQMIKYWVSSMVSKNVQIDIATPQILDQGNKKYLERLGCSIYVIPFRQRKVWKRYKAFYALCQNKKYDIVHVHTNACLDFVGLLAAKQSGVRIRIGHSHASALGNPSRVIQAINACLRPVFSVLCSRRLACSERAGKFLFGKAVFEICRNGIDTEHYKYSLTERAQIRKELKIEYKKVIGSVANFMPEKNHEIMLDILAELVEKDESYILMLLGSGPLMEEIKEKAKKLQLEDKIYFMGNRYDAYRYYSAMDLYLLCSHNEGFAVSALEAQCSGLPFFIGGNLSSEMMVLPNAYCVEKFLEPSAWAEKISGISLPSEMERLRCASELRNKGYDIRQTVEKIKREYRI